MSTIHDFEERLSKISVPWVNIRQKTQDLV